MESSIAVFLSRRSACERPPTGADVHTTHIGGQTPIGGMTSYTIAAVRSVCPQKACVTATARFVP
jgi:hypothetical protein